MYTDEEKTYLLAHKWGVLSTGRADGSPQMAMVGYAADIVGRLLISTRVTSAKWLNVARQRNVCVSVPDGRVNLIIYGTAEMFEEDPERAELSADVLAVVLGQDRPDPASITAWLDQDNRGILRITPNKALFHTD